MAIAVAIAVDRAPGQTGAVALDRSGRLLDLAIERPGAIQVGDVYRGRITARMPALAGAFVALPDGASGFLPDSAGGRAVREGDLLAVGVTRAPQGGKGPRLRAEPGAPGAGAPARLSPGPGAVARLSALYPDAPLTEGWDDAITDQVAALAEPVADLPGGGRLRIHPTPALVAIDVDLAAQASSRSAKGSAHFAANTAFLPEIVRQIRLRDLGGAIVVDLAGLSVRRRAALGDGLAAALAKDPRGPRFLGFTALGLAEILRPPMHAPLHELLVGPYATALMAARAWAREAGATPARRLALRAGLAVADGLTRDPTLWRDLRDALGEAPSVRPDATLPGLTWRLEAV